MLCQNKTYLAYVSQLIVGYISSQNSVPTLQISELIRPAADKTCAVLFVHFLGGMHGGMIRNCQYTLYTDMAKMYETLFLKQNISTKKYSPLNKSVYY